jgi:hypothetical protein
VTALTLGASLSRQAHLSSWQKALFMAFPKSTIEAQTPKEPSKNHKKGAGSQAHA